MDARGRRAKSRQIIVGRFRLPAVLLLAALAYGTTGYRLFGLPFLEAVYMTVITLTTVGFAEIRPLGDGARIFTMTLLALGMVAVFDFLGAFTSMLASGELGESIQRRRMRRRIEDLRNHYVICAYGRVGRAATAELLEQGAEVVVIEVKPELEALLQDAGVPYLIADPSEESVLLEAGIRRAKGLVCAVDSDAMSVYITLTGRALNPDLFIVARAAVPSTVDKLHRAGANRVVSHYSISGTRMAAMALRPAVVEFFDMVTVAPDLRMEEVIVARGSTLDRQRIGDIQGRDSGVSILAVRRTAGDLVVPPPVDMVLEPGDLVIALGPPQSLLRLALP